MRDTLNNQIWDTVEIKVDIDNANIWVNAPPVIHCNTWYKVYLGTWYKVENNVWKVGENVWEVIGKTVSDKTKL